MKVIRQAEVYAPDYLGKKDILLSEDKIIAIDSGHRFYHSRFFDY
ncbi:hypothetical protein [Enterococcus casseliflavus]